MTEFEAAALALEEFRERGVQFDGESGLELLEGNVTASKPVPVKRDHVPGCGRRPKARRSRSGTASSGCWISSTTNAAAPG